MRRDPSLLVNILSEPETMSTSIQLTEASVARMAASIRPDQRSIIRQVAAHEGALRLSGRGRIRTARALNHYVGETQDRLHFKATPLGHELAAYWLTQERLVALAWKAVKG